MTSGLSACSFEHLRPAPRRIADGVEEVPDGGALGKNAVFLPAVEDLPEIGEEFHLDLHAPSPDGFRLFAHGGQDPPGQAFEDIGVADAGRPRFSRDPIFARKSSRIDVPDDAEAPARRARARLDNAGQSPSPPELERTDLVDDEDVGIGVTAQDALRSFEPAGDEDNARPDRRPIRLAFMRSGTGGMFPSRRSKRS